MLPKLNDLHGRMTRLREGLDGLDIDILKHLLDEFDRAHLASLDEETIDRLFSCFHTLGIHWAGSHSQSLLNTYLPALEALAAELKQASQLRPRLEAITR